MEANDEQFNLMMKKLKNKQNISLNRALNDEILGALFNKGVDISKGDYIAKFDDDDIYGRNYLSDSIMPFAYSSANSRQT